MAQLSQQRSNRYFYFASISVKSESTISTLLGRSLKQLCLNDNKGKLNCKPGPGLKTGNTCPLCSNTGTLDHIINFCSVALNQGRYTWCNDSILGQVTLVLLGVTCQFFGILDNVSIRYGSEKVLDVV
jgi:hypothetical protein